MQTKILTFCGKKNCCPQFQREDDQIVLVDDDGNKSYLSQNQLLEMAKMFRSKTNQTILTSLGFD